MRSILYFPSAALILAATAAAPATPSDSYQPLTLSPVQAHADIALMRRALETIHPGLVRYTSRAEIDAAFAELDAVADRPVTDLELWRAIALMLARIHCDHTKPEASDTLDRYRMTHATHLPVRFRLIEGRMIVVSNDAQPGAPPPGSEIVAIDGQPAPVVLTELGRAVAYDGTTDQAIAAKLAGDSDLMGDDFNEYRPAFLGFPVRWALDWKTPGEGSIHHADLAPIAFGTWTALAWPGETYRDEFYKSVRWRLAGRTATLRVDTFVNYRNPVDADAFLGGFFKALKAAGATRLILDLRENGGGSEDVSLALGRYLLPRTFTWSKPARLKAIRYGDLPSHIESWGDRAALFEPPEANFRRLADGGWERIPRPGDEDDESALPQAVSPDRFAGAVTILTGPRNGSGATRTIAQLKENIGARLVGEDSAGSAEGPTAGHIFLLTLPNSGLKVRIPNAWNRTNIDHFVPGRGVPADELVVPTLADFAAGRDRVMEVAERGVQPPSPPALADILAGDWVGVLEYRDFGNDRRVTLPTLMTGAANGRGADLAFTFDDGPGKTVRASEQWSLGADGGTLAIGSGAEHEVFAVKERLGDADGVGETLVADGTGQENGVAVRVRLILTRRGDGLSISRLSQKPGEPMLLRDAYSLRRPAAARSPMIGAAALESSAAHPDSAPASRR